jgi:hypothetical protein
LPQNSLGSADFRTESVVVSASDRMKVKGLATTLGVSTDKPDVEVAKAALNALLDLAPTAGGDAPLPERPNVDHIRDIQAMSGNEMVVAVADSKDRLDSDAKAWQACKSLIPARLAGWTQANDLLKHAQGLGQHDDAASKLKAIESSRSLLDEPDPVAPIASNLADELRAVVKERGDRYAAARATALQGLATNPSWGALDESEQTQILNDCGLAPREGQKVGTTSELLRSLEAQPISGWQDRIDALPQQIHRAQLEVLKRTAKAPTPVQLPTSIIKDPADLERYLDDIRSAVQTHLDAGDTVVI